MSKEYDFLKECGTFYLLTMNGEFPAGRPFGFIDQRGDDLLIATHDGNQVHKQLKENGHVQIVASKTKTREWIRITGIATECRDSEARQKVFDKSTILKSHYESAESEHFLLFQIKILKTEIH
jgi:uncharacterized pyridoxamine 5'-phosphate oxidase family protein